MNPNLAALAYLVAGVLFIFALRGLSSPESSRAGNRNGIIGMIIAVVTTLLVAGVSDALTWGLIIAGLAVGGVIGATIARTVTLAPGASATWTRFEESSLGPFILNDDLNVTAYLTSTFTFTGVPFVANASTTAGVFLLDEGDSRSWLPMIRRE